MNQRRQAHANPTRRFVRKLAAYSAPAAALIAPEAEAAIIYTDLGPNGIRVFDSFHEIDFDSNGQTDVTLAHYYSAEDPASNTFPSTFFDARAFGRIIGASSFQGFRIFAKAFAYDELIQRGSRANSFGTLAYRVESTDGRFEGGAGEFYGLRRAYLGVTFQTEDNSHHMGWIEVDARYADSIDIFGYAYESTPDRSIRAGAIPEPPSLLLLAAGAAGLGVWRCRHARHEQS